MQVVLLRPAVVMQQYKTYADWWMSRQCVVVWCAAGKRIKCSRLDGPGILLLGDAAHAVTPVSVMQHLMEGCLCQPVCMACVCCVIVCIVLVLPLWRALLRAVYYLVEVAD